VTPFIGWVLLHSVWQGGVIAAALGGALFLTRRSTSRVRYRLSLAALALCILAPVATVAITESTSLNGVPALGAGGSVAPQASGSPAVDHPVVPTAEPAAISRLETIRIGSTDRGARLLTVIRQWIDAYLPWLVIGWLAGVTVVSIRLLGGVWRIRRLASSEQRPAGPELRNAALRAAAALRVDPLPRIQESSRITVPQVVGWLRPLILLPVSFGAGLTPAQIEMILAHELAHIRRRDVAVNLIQTIFEALLFYHPAAWWIGRRIRAERENCCDDLALSASGGDRVAYTAALVTLEELRGTALALSAAAVGEGRGLLWHRARRLLTGAPAHADLGPAWMAGVVTLAASLLVSGRAIPAAAQVTSPRADAPAVTVTDSAGARPSSVTRVETGGELAIRWRRADSSAAAGEARLYWVGYRIHGDSTSRDWYFFDEIPVVTGLGASSGHLHFTGTELGEIRVPGVPVTSITGAAPPRDIVVFLAFRRTGRVPVLTRVHVANVAFPMYFGGAPLVWLGTASDGESIRQLAALSEAAPTDHLRLELVATQGLHLDAVAAVPALRRWLEDVSANAGVRQEGARWLGRYADPAALRSLARAARGDRAPNVRVQSLQALGHMPIATVTDTLIDFVGTFEPGDFRFQALESLSHRVDTRAVAFLGRTARAESADMSLRLKAVESLASMDDALGRRDVYDLARHAAAAEIRHAAIGALGRIYPTGDAPEVAATLARTDPSPVVRVKAVESLGTFDSERAVASLHQLAMAGPDDAIQQAAAAALAYAHPHEPSIEAMTDIARRHPRRAVRLIAVDGLGTFEDAPEVMNILRALARSAADDSVRARANTMLNPGRE
jgi:beta-lactamase regulating signal transducer with metallopeptidase domain/HEAT repeat protein